MPVSSTVKETGQCPHCKGRNGVTCDQVLKAVRWERWDGTDADTDNMTLLRESRLRCVDCGKRITRGKLSAMRGETSLAAQ